MQVNTSYAAQTAQQASQTSAAQTANYAKVSNYLKSLKERFPNANIGIRDFNSAKDIEDYANGQIGSFNGISISGQALEKMANDPAMAARIEGEMQTFLDEEQNVRNRMKQNGEELLARGMVVDKNGDTKHWLTGGSSTNGISENSLPTISAKALEKIRETWKKQMEEKEAEKKKAEEEIKKANEANENAPAKKPLTLAEIQDAARNGKLKDMGTISSYGYVPSGKGVNVSV
jgi:hypothetical protein